MQKYCWPECITLMTLFVSIYFPFPKTWLVVVFIFIHIDVKKICIP